jgi:hypothetical protein
MLNKTIRILYRLPWRWAFLRKPFIQSIEKQAYFMDTLMFEKGKEFLAFSMLNRSDKFSLAWALKGCILWGRETSVPLSRGEYGHHNTVSRRNANELRHSDSDQAQITNGRILYAGSIPATCESAPPLAVTCAHNAHKQKFSTKAAANSSTFQQQHGTGQAKWLGSENSKIVSPRTRDKSREKDSGF